MEGEKERESCRKDEAIQQKDDMVLFPFSFWEFLYLCEAMPDHWAQTVLCVCACGIQARKKVYAKMWNADIFEARIIPLCVSEDNPNYNCIAAQSRDLSQVQTKPCWTRLNQAWTSSTQHALHFKPWLIGPKASKSCSPAVTGTGLGKEEERERRKRARKKGERDFFFLNQFE